jgi:hypothetical protein
MEWLPGFTDNLGFAFKCRSLPLRLAVMNIVSLARLNATHPAAFTVTFCLAMLGYRTARGRDRIQWPACTQIAKYLNPQAILVSRVPIGA